LFSVIVGVVY